MTEIGEHYSEKGGHFLRGEFWKIQRQLARCFPDCHARDFARVPVHIAWQQRRFMARYGIRDGRR